MITLEEKKRRAMSTNALRRHSLRHIRRTVSLLNRLYYLADKDDVKFDMLMEAVKAHIEVLPFLVPKLQAVAMAELQEDGTLTPATYASIVAFMSQQRQQNAEGSCRPIEAETVKAIAAPDTGQPV